MDEINHMIEIMNSRSADVPKVHQECKDIILSARGAKDTIGPQNLRRPTEGKQDDSNKAVWDVATPLPKPTLYMYNPCVKIQLKSMLPQLFIFLEFSVCNTSYGHGMGSCCLKSKSYMTMRTPEVNVGSKSAISKDERPIVLSDNFESESFVPLPSPKSSTCWPGSMVQDQRGYLTPHSQRGRFGLHNIPRTPYFRTIYSKSKSKLDHVQDKGNGFLNGSFSPLQQLQTPRYGQSLDGNRSSEINIPPVHPHSSHMERSILEHLERNLVTRKEKSEVLKIATSSKISESLDANANRLPCLGLGSSKSKNQINNRSPAQWNEDRGKSFSVPSPLNTIEAKDVNRTSASEFEAHSTITMFGNNAGSSLDFGKFQNSQIKTAQEDHSKAGASEKPCNSIKNKSVLASISVSKPEQRWISTLDNSTGFTFPVSASSGVSSEP
ncbi:hypothetical protein V6Z12_D05G016500 [Gossypium hirsutum]